MKDDNFEDIFATASTGGSIIKVIGVGGGGCNAVDHMYKLGIKDVSFVVTNTDAQALNHSPVPLKIQLGQKITEGLGAGSDPERGRMAAEESLKEINAMLQTNTKMVFITAGMGGGTGTGAAPVIAKAAKDLGILTVAVVTIPFRGMEKDRITTAFAGVKELQRYVDSLLVINNEKLRELYGALKVSEAFAKADDILCTAVKGIAEIITLSGTINVDFADVRTAMQNSGIALMGTGRGVGSDRVDIAIEQAINSPLLYNNSIRGAKHVLVNIMTGGNELSLDEMTSITDRIREETGDPLHTKTGLGLNPDLGDEVTVSLIATGFEISDIDGTNTEVVTARAPKRPEAAPKDDGIIVVDEGKESYDCFGSYDPVPVPSGAMPQGDYGGYNPSAGKSPIPIWANTSLSIEKRESDVRRRSQKRMQPRSDDNEVSLFSINPGNNGLGSSSAAFLNRNPD